MNPNQRVTRKMTMYIDKRITDPQKIHIEMRVALKARPPKLLIQDVFKNFSKIVLS